MKSETRKQEGEGMDMEPMALGSRGKSLGKEVSANRVAGDTKEQRRLLLKALLQDVFAVQSSATENPIPNSSWIS